MATEPFTVWRLRALSNASNMSSSVVEADEGTKANSGAELASSGAPRVDRDVRTSAIVPIG